MTQPNGKDAQFLQQFEKEQLQYFSKYFDIEKLKPRIPSFEYLMADLKLLETKCDSKNFQSTYQKKTLLKSIQAKKLCREGISLKYIKEFLLKMFHVEFSPEDYATKCKFVFKGRQVGDLGNFVPLFTNQSFEESLPLHFLTKEGIEALKEILWLLNSVHPAIDYSPLIIKLTSLLLIFLSKEETYEIMRTLLELNLNPLEINKIRWHYRFTYDENLKISSSINESIHALSDPQTNKKITHIVLCNCTCDKLFQDISASFFIDYLNFVGVIRFLPFYLYEGTKAIYRMAYAVMKNIEVDKITKKETPKDVLDSFKEKALAIKDMAKLYQDAYHFHLTRNNNKFAEQEITDIGDLLSRRNYYYLPTFFPPSLILSDANIISLWGLLPLEVKTFDGRLIYDTMSSPDADLKTLYEMCSKNDKTSVILTVIETVAGDKFGFIMNQNIEFCEDGQWLTPGNAYLYSIQSTVNVYKTKKGQTDIVRCEPGVLRFGNGSEGAAISIGHDLKSGWSEEESIFGKAKLTTNESGEFAIKNMEIFLMV